MSLKTRKESQPPANRFGVHFEYTDLCARLKELEAAQNPHTGASGKLLPTVASLVSSQKKRILPFAHSRYPKKGLGVKQTDSNVSKSTINCSFTLHTRQGPGKLPVHHKRQSSLPVLAHTQKVLLRPHKKSCSQLPYKAIN